jgi:hypothetical protein
MGLFEDLSMPTWLAKTPLRRVWLDAYIETGDAALALEAVRRDERYDNYFAGNRRDDGSLIYDEATYMSVVDSFSDALRAVNINPNNFKHLYPDLIQGYVSPNEFTTRVETMYERVLSAAPEIRQYYRDNFGLEMTRPGIVASFLDPDIGTAILERRIAMSEIGGEAEQKGFSLSTMMADRLLQTGLTGETAQRFFSMAAEETPIIQALRERHLDPGDEFNIMDFSQYVLEEDPEMRRTMRALVGRELAGFQEGQANLTTRTDQATGGLTGLAAR